MIAPVDNATVRPAALDSRGAAALRTLRAAGRRPDAASPAVRHEAAAQLVSELFLKPLLADLREFPFGRELTGGGQTERTFGAQLDERLADQVARADRGLVRQVVRELEGTAPAPGADRAHWPAAQAARRAPQEAP